MSQSPEPRRSHLQECRHRGFLRISCIYGKIGFRLKCLHTRIIFSLRAPGTPEIPCRLSSRLEGSLGLLRCHCDGCLDFSQTASSSSSQYRRGRSLFIRELANNQEIMVTEGQVPPDEPTSYALAEFGNSFLTIFWFGQHALDSLWSEPPT